MQPYKFNKLVTFIPEINEDESYFVKLHLTKHSGYQNPIKCLENKSKSSIKCAFAHFQV